MTDDSIPGGQTDNAIGSPLRLRCRCLLIHAPDDLRIEEQDAGEMAPGQVTVQVGMGGICGSDLHYFHHGGFGTVRIKRPMVLGHEVAGTVIAVAPDVTRVQVGDRVAVSPSRGDRLQSTARDLPCTPAPTPRLYCTGSWGGGPSLRRRGCSKMPGLK